jgi:hypothetical protein
MMVCNVKIGKSCLNKERTEPDNSPYIIICIFSMQGRRFLSNSQGHTFYNFEVRKYFWATRYMNEERCTEKGLNSRYGLPLISARSSFNENCNKEDSDFRVREPLLNVISRPSAKQSNLCRSESDTQDERKCGVTSQPAIQAAPLSKLIQLYTWKIINCKQIN